MSRFTQAHLRLVSGLSILWYAINAIDYTATQMALPFYTQLFTPEQVDYFTSMPAWVNAVWAIAVWGGLLGSLLMWSQRRRSAAILAIGAGGMAILTLWLLMISRPPMFAVTGWGGVWIMLGATFVCFAIWIYARAMHRAGHLP